MTGPLSAKDMGNPVITLYLIIITSELALNWCNSFVHVNTLWSG